MRPTTDPRRWRPAPARRRRPLHVRLRRLLPASRRLQLLLLLAIAALAIAPPVFLHLRLRRLHDMREHKCGWAAAPPPICAHGGNSRNAFPNSMEAFRLAVASRVDCVEVDVSRSSDGTLFALHDRDLQRLSGNLTAKVGLMTATEVRALNERHQLLSEIQNLEIPLVFDVLEMLARSVKQVILDVKIGPPIYEKGLAQDVLAIVKRSRCVNCLIWAKSDSLLRDVIKLSQDVKVGYIVMSDPSTGIRSKLVRLKGAEVVGIYHPLIHHKVVKVLHRNRKKVYAWTVDDRDSMLRMLSLRVDAIVTGNPTLLQEVMQSVRSECSEEGSELM